MHSPPIPNIAAFNNISIFFFMNWKFITDFDEKFFLLGVQITIFRSSFCIYGLVYYANSFNNTFYCNDRSYLKNLASGITFERLIMAAWPLCKYLKENPTTSDKFYETWVKVSWTLLEIFISLYTSTFFLLLFSELKTSSCHSRRKHLPKAPTPCQGYR